MCFSENLWDSLWNHPLSFGEFEGQIPEGQYGAGRIEIWDRGSYEAIEWTQDRVVFDLQRDRLRGTYDLVRFKRKGTREWLLFRRSAELNKARSAP